jgi:hypothetical protein
MFKSLFTAGISIFFLIIFVHGLIVFYKRISNLIFRKYPNLSKIKGLVSGIIIAIFVVVFSIIVVFIQETFNISLL